MAAKEDRAVPASVADKLYSAANVIARAGLEHTKIDDIAAASGVPKATLYYYFTGKDDILSFLLRDSLATLASEVAAAADGPGPGRDRLAAVIRVQIEHTMNRPDSSRALVGDLGRVIRLPELAAAVQNAFYAPIARVLLAGSADGSLRSLSDPDASAVSIFGTIIMTAMLHNVIVSDTTVDEVVDGVIDLIMNGLAPSTR